MSKVGFFATIEEKIIDYWDQIDAFQKSLKLSEGRPEYLFYDGIFLSS
jgi:isoleucyl-tRNA synthetase